MEEKILLIKVVIFAHKKFYHKLSMHGQKALGFHQKYLNLCFEDEQRSYSVFPLQRQICAQCRWQRYNTTALGRVKFRSKNASENNIYTLFAFNLFTAIVVTRRFSLDICIKSRNAQLFFSGLCSYCILHL